MSDITIDGKLYIPSDDLAALEAAVAKLKEQDKSKVTRGQAKAAMDTCMKGTELALSFTNWSDCYLVECGTFEHANYCLELARKHPLVASTAEAQLRQMEKWGRSESIARMEQSIAAGWRGLFPLKTEAELAEPQEDER